MRKQTTSSGTWAFRRIKTYCTSQLRLTRSLLAIVVILSLIAGVLDGVIGGLPHVQAQQTEFSMQTGYYLGDGVPISITGLGFRPEVVIIKSDTAAGQLVWKSSEMPSSVSAYLGVATADNTESEIILNDDGFSLSSALEVNTNKVRYVWIAFAGSDCTSEGTMCIGKYTGNTPATQAIQTGFQPDFVWVKRGTAVAGNFVTSSMTPTHAGFFSAAANNTVGAIFQSLNAGGFTVGTTNNTSGGVFYFVAFKNTAGKMKVGSFLGDGEDNRNVTGVGFEPDFVFVKQDSAIVPAFNITESYGDYSSVTTAAAGAVNHIQSLNGDGFQVGNSTSVNAVGVMSYYVAFGGASDHATSGTFLMKKGSYDGNGDSQSIDTGFKPDLVFIKGNTAQYAVWSSIMDYDQTHYFALAAVAFASSITSMNATSFSIGNHATVNSNGLKYEYVAFGNATNPRQGGKASDFVIGTYTGNGGATRNINHLGVTPDFVVVKPPTVAAASNINVWRSSAMAADTSAFFAATADLTDGTGFRSLSSASGGTFVIGSGPRVNTVNVTYSFFAFKEGAGTFDVGSYLGTGEAQNVTGVGFSPDFAWTKRSSAAAAVHRSSSDTIASGQSQHFLNLANDTNDITGFVEDGFSVGTSAEVNTSGAGNTYSYAAWHSPNSSAPPDTPTNASPASGATAQDLNTVISGSAYNDPDSNDQTNAQWQVDDDSDFSTPVWSRTAGTAETSTSITAGSGTFANELSGLTELSHGSTYYWRVRYADTLWSGWSTATNYTTNTFPTPTNSSPANGGTVTTLTPMLTATAFSDPQPGHEGVYAEWQISVSTNFSSPIYTSGSVEYDNSFTVPNAVLSDRSIYYWRVRYQDSGGQWSSYSTPSRFLTSESIISVKTLFGNTAVNQGDSVKIDAQVKRSNEAAINDATVTVNIYNPSGTKIVDGGAMNYLSGSSGIYRYPYAVPSTNGTYVYEVTAVSGTDTGVGTGNFEVGTITSDINALSTDISSAGSTLNKVNRQIKAGILNTETTVRSGNSITIRYSATGGLTGAGAPRLSVYDSSDIKRVDGAEMTEIGSTGIYRSTVTLLEAWGTGSFTIDVVENTNNTSGRMSLYVGASDIQSIGADVTTVKGDVQETKGNLDILVGAFIVTQGTVDDETATPTSFITSLTNSTTDFYKNAVLTFTSGDLNGQVRRISAYDGATKAIVLDPALAGAPANGDAFTITKQNVRVEEQVAVHEVAQAVSRTRVEDIQAKTTDVQEKVTDIQTRTADIQSKVDAISTLLSTVDTNLTNMQLSINDIRASQERNYTARLSDVSEMQPGKTYRALLSVTDYEGSPADAAETPTLVLYDALRAEAVSEIAMTRLSTGVYSYTYEIPSDGASGLWETTASVDTGGSAALTLNDYWQLTGSPAQVIINHMSDLTVPTISANTTIQNEGSGPYEYQYQYCVVAVQADACDGASVVASASAAKLIQAGELFTSDLALTVPEPGSYWFKVIVRYGTDVSGASRSFTATEAQSSSSSSAADATSSAAVVTPSPSAGNSRNQGSLLRQQEAVQNQDTATTSMVAELAAMRMEMQTQSAQLAKALALLGNVDILSPGFRSLLDINGENTKDLKEIQNKIIDLRTISSVTKKLTEQRLVEPIVETYMKFNSVEIHFLITNPSDSVQTLKFRAFLPEEARPEHVLDLDGLKIDYDASAKTYVVSGDVTVAAHQSITKKVELTDVWVFDEKEITLMQDRAGELADTLAHTNLAGQAVILKGDIVSTINVVLTSQRDSYSSPQEHIVVYRQNLDRMKKVKEELDQLKSLVLSAGSSQSIVGKVGSIEIFATWGIILAIVFGFTLLAGLFFMMWRHQIVFLKSQVEGTTPKKKLRSRQSRSRKRAAVSLRTRLLHAA